jgi:hypothetical protein
VSDLDAAVDAHARRLVAGDAAARDDLAPDAPIEPADLLDRLLGARLHGFHRVAHARIGAYHVVKVRYVGAPSLVVQACWARDVEGRWRVREVELTRVAVEDEG